MLVYCVFNILDKNPTSNGLRFKNGVIFGRWAIFFITFASVKREIWRMEKIRQDYKKCITATTWNENECNDDARAPSLFLEEFPYRGAFFPL